MQPIEIDGSFGEGGGQILRTAASFSVVLGTPIHVTKIRAGRTIPGLRPQHCATLRILAEISGGHVLGNSVGSTEVTFVPGAVESRRMSFDLQTAASIPLVLQAIIPAVALAGASMDLDLVGGTDVPWSPTFDYLERVLRPALQVTGIVFSPSVSRHGYYPSGGGMASVHIDPCKGARPVQFTGRPEAAVLSMVSRCCKLPPHVAERQAKSASEVLRGRGIGPGKTDVITGDSLSPGSSILISLVGEGCYLGADSIGSPKKSAERVGADAAHAFVKLYDSGATVDSHLADMLAPILCLAEGESSLLTPETTGHLRTSLEVARQLTGASYETREQGRAFLVRIAPARAK
jgi:RNA 3'-phosphate cyclase